MVFRLMSLWYFTQLAVFSNLRLLWRQQGSGLTPKLVSAHWGHAGTLSPSEPTADCSLIKALGFPSTEPKCEVIMDGMRPGVLILPHLLFLIHTYPLDYPGEIAMRRERNQKRQALGPSPRILWCTESALMAITWSQKSLKCLLFYIRGPNQC